MANTSFNLVDGIKNIYYAVMTDEVAETYGEVKLLTDKVVEFGMTPQQNSTPVYGSNREITNLKGALSADVTLTVLSLDSDVLAELMGKVKATEGGYIDKNGKRPFIYMIAEKSMEDGESEFVCLYKVQFNLNEERAQTKTGDSQVQNQSFSGRAMQVKDYTLKYAVRTSDLTEAQKTALLEKVDSAVIKPTVAVA